MPTKGFYTALTLIELLVVITVLGVLAAVVAPNIAGWNCRQEVHNDFERLNGFMQTLRLEAVNRNRTMLARVNRGGNNAIIMAYQGPQSKKKSCSGAGWSYRGRTVGDIMDYRSEKSSLSYTKRDVCFEADGTATPSLEKKPAYIISRQCDGKNYQFRNFIFGVSGFINKEKRYTTTGNGTVKWDEL